VTERGSYEKKRKRNQRRTPPAFPLYGCRGKKWGKKKGSCQKKEAKTNLRGWWERDRNYWG